MGDRDMSRRGFMLGASSSALTWAAAQVFETSNAKVSPADVRSRLMALERDGFDNSLLKMEREPLPTLSKENVYLESLPRLVQLVDRAKDRKRQLADRAATLLGELNTQEKGVPVLYSPFSIERPSPLFQLQSVEQGYREMYDALSVRREYTERVKWYADRLTSNRRRYAAVSSRTTVPWYVIGVIHALEASFNFLGHLHNGDVPLGHQTIHAPSGKPDPWSPPYTWERSAEDALRVERFDGLTDWSLSSMLYRLESYNGFGYRSKNVNSPYLWSFSHYYDAGKFVKDGVWSAAEKSQQCGAAVMIHELSKRGVITI